MNSGALYREHAIKIKNSEYGNIRPSAIWRGIISLSTHFCENPFMRDVVHALKGEVGDIKYKIQIKMQTYLKKKDYENVNPI